MSKKKKRNVNIFKVAEEAGVSKSTVSRVINNKANVSEKTRKKVLETMKELNYRPNIAAKTLVTNNTHTIGIVVSDITHPFFSEFIKGIEAKIMKEDYNIMFSSSHWVAEEEKKHIRMFEEGRVDGIIMVSGAVGEYNDYITNMVTRETPIVLIDRKIIDKDIIQLNLNNVDAGYRGTKYLIDAGHKNIAFINGTDIASSNASKDRTIGYKKALEDYNLTNQYIYSGGFDREKSYKTTQKVLKKHEEITAIFYASDMMAVGGYKAIREAGLKVPEDISVLGIDGLDIGLMIHPPLSTLKQPRYQMGYNAAERLINKLENKEEKNKPYKEEYYIKLIDRSSIKKIK